MAIKDWPQGEGPREKLLLNGAGQLSDAELLAVILRNGLAGKNALELSRQLIMQFGGYVNYSQLLSSKFVKLTVLDR